MTQWKPMDTAPRDGTRILLEYWPVGYNGAFYEKYGDTKVEEAFFDKADPHEIGSVDVWRPWTGSTEVFTTACILEEHCFGWMEKPE